ADAVGLFRLEGADGPLRLAAGSAPDGAPLPGGAALDAGWIGAAMREARALAAADGELEGPWLAGLAVPLVGRGQRYGAMVLLYMGARAFDADDLALAAA